MSGHVSMADFGGHFSHLGDPTTNGGAFARHDVVSALNQALEMRKSLSTGSNPALGFQDGSALIPQSLEMTLQVVSFKMKELKMWQRISKAPALAMFEEFDVLQQYGSDETMWMQEGGLPAEDGSIYSREVAQVKFLGTTRSVTHPMQMVRTITGVDPIIEREDMNGVMQILRNLETAFFYGDDRVNPLSIKGLLQQVQTAAPDNVIDLRGKPLTDKTLMDLDNASADRYGTLDTLFMSNKQKNNLSQILMQNKRLLLSEMGQDYNLGVTASKFVGNNSEGISLESHQFIREGGAPPTTVADLAPAAPGSITITPRAAGVSEVSRFGEGATLTYEVHAINAKGEGLGVVSTPTAVDAGDVLDVVFPNVTGAQFYRIYRKNNGGKMLKLTEVGRGASANVTFTDLNQFIEGTSMAFALMTVEDAIKWKQLAPLMKLPLATLDTRTRWAILLYGAMMVYQPKKQFVCINVGNGDITHDVDLVRPRN